MNQVPARTVPPTLTTGDSAPPLSGVAALEAVDDLHATLRAVATNTAPAIERVAEFVVELESVKCGVRLSRYALMTSVATLLGLAADSILRRGANPIGLIQLRMMVRDGAAIIEVEDDGEPRRAVDEPAALAAVRDAVQVGTGELMVDVDPICGTTSRIFLPLDAPCVRRD